MSHPLLDESSPMTALFLGIDIGTSSSKATLADATGAVIATAATTGSGIRMTMPRPNHAEMDADAVWWADLVTLCRDLAAQRGGLADVTGVTVSGIGPCFLPVDASGAPLRASMLYGIDMRARDEIRELRDRYGDDEVLARCASPLTSQAVGPKALWFRRHEPELFAQTSRWFSASSYLAYRLTGEYVIDHHTASQDVPLYDLRAATWIDEWYDDLLPGVERPRLVWPTEQIGAVTDDAALATGLPAGVAVMAGTVDAWAEAFSGGVREPGDLMLMYGSTVFFVQVLAEVASHPELWNTAGVDVGSLCLAAGMLTSGTLTEWVRTVTGGAPFSELIAAADSVPAGSDGLLMLPYFAGERTPIFDPDARGVITGLTLAHGPGHLLRAAYEGIAFGIRQIVELLDAPANPVRRIVGVGGGTQSALWTQIVSDVTGREQEIPEVTIGASYGGALMAAIGTGQVAPETSWHRTAQVITPQPAMRGRYDKLYRNYLALYPATREIVHDTVRLTR